MYRVEFYIRIGFEFHLNIARKRSPHKDMSDRITRSRNVSSVAARGFPPARRRIVSL